jgi:hypothetical protein
LAASCLEPWCSPPCKRFRRHSKGQTATTTKTRLVLLPVRHLEFHLADMVSTGGVVLMRHAGSITPFSIAAA